MRRRLFDKDILIVQQLLDKGYSHAAIGREFGVNGSSVDRFVKKQGKVGTIKRKARRTTIADNLFGYCDQSGGPDACWPWLRAHCSKGYGNVWFGGRCRQAHCVAYELRVGPIPDGFDGKPLQVRHSCDNPPCINPNHLLVGTNLDNMRDREERGRGNQPSGEECGRSKITARHVILIRRCSDLFNTRELAEMVGLDAPQVARILRGMSWGWVIDDKNVCRSVLVERDDKLVECIGPEDL